MDINETIEAFRRGAIDLDCKKIVLTQRKEDGERFEGQGYIRQTEEGALEHSAFRLRHILRF